MIKNIKIKAFKSFVDSTIPLTPLTVLTGLNGSGKSTVVQSLRMLLNSSSDKQYLSGFGGFEELRSKYCHPDDNICIKIEMDDSETHNLEIGKEGPVSIENETSIVFEYIGAERLGPQAYLPISHSRKITVGEKGEFCSDFFDKFEGCIINDVMAHSGTQSKTLKEQLNTWMREISPNVVFSFGIDKKHDTSVIEIDSHRATNTGFGLSYALPIVLSSLVMSSRECNDFKESFVEKWFHDLNHQDILFVVENPEAHIHPQGQTMLGMLMFFLSSCGVQVLVETHSDHFIDGVRIAAKELGRNESASIIFFTKENNAPTNFEVIDILDNGSLSRWPDGFFDQIQKNLLRLSRRQ
ncbi:DUF3696 domain-containing protein [Gallaecimonas pentaromativorans]|uniref:DUF3696 domain-containing protein n=1 Tax=Gallaecimonas pentaromativorans TaxID=584787 RepID=UPI003A90526D